MRHSKDLGIRYNPFSKVAYTSTAGPGNDGPARITSLGLIAKPFTLEARLLLDVKTMQNNPIRVIAIDDHPLMLKIIAEALTGHTDIRFVGKAEHGSQLFRLVRETSPDVVVLDLGMTGQAFEPVTAVRELRQLYPQINVLVLTGYDNELYMRQLTQAGARGYLLKSDGNSVNLADAVRRIHRGELLFSPAVVEKLLEHEQNFTLNDREVGIVRLVAAGNSNQHIGEILGLSERRVRNVLTGIYARLGIQGDNEKNRRVLLVTRAREMGLLEKS